MIKHPNDIKWIEGMLPSVESVPYDARVLVWLVHWNDSIMIDHPTGGIRSYTFRKAPELNGKLKSIGLACPYQDKLNPLKWNYEGLPINHEEVRFWAWLT